MPTFTDPQTGDLNSTESKVVAIQYFNSPIEHTLVFNRPGRNEHVNMGISHFDAQHELTLTVFELEGDEPVEIAEQMNLSYQEALLLRSLLNRPEVLAFLNRGDK